MVRRFFQFFRREDDGTLAPADECRGTASLLTRCGPVEDPGLAEGEVIDLRRRTRGRDPIERDEGSVLQEIHREGFTPVGRAPDIFQVDAPVVLPERGVRTEGFEIPEDPAGMAEACGRAFCDRSDRHGAALPAVGIEVSSLSVHFTGEQELHQDDMAFPSPDQGEVAHHATLFVDAGRLHGPLPEGGERRTRRPGRKGEGLVRKSAAACGADEKKKESGYEIRCVHGCHPYFCSMGIKIKIRND